MQGWIFSRIPQITLGKNFPISKVWDGIYHDFVKYSPLPRVMIDNFTSSVLSGTISIGMKIEIERANITNFTNIKPPQLNQSWSWIWAWQKRMLNLNEIFSTKSVAVLTNRLIKENNRRIERNMQKIQARKIQWQ